VSLLVYYRDPQRTPNWTPCGGLRFPSTLPSLKARTFLKYIPARSTAAGGPSWRDFDDCRPLVHDGPFPTS
jgi:hypothetical protein